MTQMLTRPDVDLVNGMFYADGGAREAYRWMRANEPVFRDRNGLAAATTYQPCSTPNATPNCSRRPAASGPISRACPT